MKLQTKYMALKATTIFFGALSIPWSTFTGFCFGEGRYMTGLISLAAQTVIALIDGYIWFWVLENMRNKMQAEAGEHEASHIASCPFLAQEAKALGAFQPAYRPAAQALTSKEDVPAELTAPPLDLKSAVEQT